jgi:hypothetical protein
VTVPLLGDVGTVAVALAEELAGHTDTQPGWVDQRPDVAARWAIWRGIPAGL